MTTEDDCTRLIADIDRRVAQMTFEVRLGARHEEASDRQTKELLAILSQLESIELPHFTAVSTHMQSNGVWTRTQLAAFNACLRLALRLVPKKKPRLDRTPADDQSESRRRKKDTSASDPGKP